MTSRTCSWACSLAANRSTNFSQLQHQLGQMAQRMSGLEKIQQEIGKHHLQHNYRAMPPENHYSRLRAEMQACRGWLESLAKEEKTTLKQQEEEDTKNMFSESLKDQLDLLHEETTLQFERLHREIGTSFNIVAGYINLVHETMRGGGEKHTASDTLNEKHLPALEFQSIRIKNTRDSMEVLKRDVKNALRSLDGKIWELHMQDILTDTHPVTGKTFLDAHESTMRELATKWARDTGKTPRFEHKPRNEDAYYDDLDD